MTPLSKIRNFGSKYYRFSVDDLTDVLGFAANHHHQSPLSLFLSISQHDDRNPDAQSRPHQDLSQ